MDLLGGTKAYVKIAYAIIEVMGEGRQQAVAGEINPFKAQEGEIFPLNMERNLSAL